MAADLVSSLARSTQLMTQNYLVTHAHAANTTILTHQIGGILDGSSLVCWQAMTQRALV